MLYEIKVLKAPWPKGSTVGDVVDLPNILPAWAVGKCAQASEGAHATVEMEEVIVADDMQLHGDADKASIDSLLARLREADARASGQGEAMDKLVVELKAGASEIGILRAQLDAAEQAGAELRRQLESAKAAYAALGLERDAAVAEASALRDQLTAAQPPADATASTTKAKAK